MTDVVIIVKYPVNKLMRKSINSHRLNYDARERLPLKWLTKREIYNRYYNRLSQIKALILCMDKGNNNYEHLPKLDKDKVELLIKNEEVVDIVLITLFQWLGTNVGSHDVRDLINEIFKIDQEGNPITPFRFREKS